MVKTALTGKKVITPEMVDSIENDITKLLPDITVPVKPKVSGHTPPPRVRGRKAFQRDINSLPTLSLNTNPQKIKHSRYASIADSDDLDLVRESKFIKHLPSRKSISPVMTYIENFE